GLEWTVAGFGDFSGRANETDMLMRNSNTGAFEVYDISNNTITSAQPMGQVGLEWQIAGFGDFSTRAGETDMLLRNSNNGAFEVYDIVNNTITSAQPMGQVGLEWTIAGFGNFSGNANETDMLMRNSNSGVFTLYDISNNTVTGTAPMGQVGLEWSISGVSASVAGAPPEQRHRATHPGDGVVRAKPRHVSRGLAGRPANGTSTNQRHLADDQPRLDLASWTLSERFELGLGGSQFGLVTTLRCRLETQDRLVLGAGQQPELADKEIGIAQLSRFLGGIRITSAAASTASGVSSPRKNFSIRAGHAVMSTCGMACCTRLDRLLRRSTISSQSAP
ncbi:hypothetical protein, partial [Bradyrhizobium sp.]|uniref:hypothetical protein n=1 Tax=Bradyrhizobium sp. TaxID=376 RepID=UPI003C3629D3